jgi:hypothetical protein
VWVNRPEDGRLEDILVSLLIERFLRLQPEGLGRFLGMCEALMVRAVEAGRRLYRSDALAGIGDVDAPGMISVVGSELWSGVTGHSGVPKFTFSRAVRG